MTTMNKLHFLFLYIKIYKDQLSTLGQIRLRAENCLVSKEKRRGTVYTRTKTSTRDMFLFERIILLCKKKDEGNAKTLQYQYKEMIKVTKKNERSGRRKYLVFVCFCSIGSRYCSLYTSKK